MYYYWIVAQHISFLKIFYASEQGDGCASIRHVAFGRLTLTTALVDYHGSPPHAAQ